MNKIFYLLLLFPALVSAQVVDVTRITRSAGSAPSLTTSIQSLNSFQANQGSPSAADSFQLSGTNLTGTVTVTAPTGYELSKDKSTWTSPLTYTPSGGAIPSQPVWVYVRLTSSASGTPSGQVACTSSGAAERDVNVTGVVTSSSPTISPSTTSLPSYSYTTGSASSPPQTYTITGANLTANVGVKPPSWLEVSLDNITYADTLSLARSSTILTGQPVTIYTHGKAANIVGAYSGIIKHTSTGATEQDIAVNGTVNAGASNVAQWNFTATSQPVVGWNNMSGDPRNGQVVNDPNTGWTLTSIGANWGAFFGTVYGTNDQGAPTGGTYSSEFPQPAIAGNYLQITIYFNGTNYGLELTGAAAGSYTVQLCASVKSTYNNGITNPEYHVKFGTGSDQLSRAMQCQDNTGSGPNGFISFTGTISAGQKIYISTNQDVNNIPGAAALSALRVIKN